LTPGYRYLLNITFCNGVGGRASGLQTHPSHYLFTWYNTTAEWDANSLTGQAQIKYECIVTCTPSNEQTLQCPSTQSQSKMRW